MRALGDRSVGFLQAGAGAGGPDRGGDLSSGATFLWGGKPGEP